VGNIVTDLWAFTADSTFFSHGDSPYIKEKNLLL